MLALECMQDTSKYMLGGIRYLPDRPARAKKPQFGGWGYPRGGVAQFDKKCNILFLSSIRTTVFGARTWRPVARRRSLQREKFKYLRAWALERTSFRSRLRERSAAAGPLTVAQTSTVGYGWHIQTETSEHGYGHPNAREPPVSVSEPL